MAHGNVELLTMEDGSENKTISISGQTIYRVTDQCSKGSPHGCGSLKLKWPHAWEGIWNFQVNIFYNSWYS